MRILLTVPSLGREFGGPLGKARDLVAELRAAGLDVRLAGAGADTETAAEGADVALGELARFRATPVPRRLSPLRRLVRGADLVHVLGFRDPVGTLAALEARRAGVPLVLEPAGMVRPRLRSLRLKRGFDSTVGLAVLRGAAVVIAASDLEAAELRAHHVSAERIRVRPNGVRFIELLPLPERGAFRRAYGIGDEVPLILTIARIGAVKGLPTLLRALAEVPEAHVAVAGPDERDGTLGELHALRRSLALVDRVLVVPRGIWGEGKREALADADVFCLPSDSESFGTAAAEAAGCGLPVVTTSGCGVVGVLAPSATRVVPPGDVTALGAALREALGSGEMREAARGSAGALRDRLDWSNLVQEQLLIYRDVRGVAPPRRRAIWSGSARCCTRKL